MKNNEIKIPKSFYIFGRKIIVEYNDLYLSAAGLSGEADYVKNKILLAQKSGLDEFPQDEQEHTFLHEMLHQILDKTGWQPRLFADRELREHFVDTVAAALHQAFKTAEYED